MAISSIPSSTLDAVKAAELTSVERYLSVNEVAQYTGLSVAYLNRLRTTGGGAPFIKIGARVVYAVADLDAWLGKHRRKSTSDAGAA